MPWWYYTLGTEVIRIIADQKIRRADAGVLTEERKGIWFSCRDTWEPMATKLRFGPDAIRADGTVHPSKTCEATVQEMRESDGAFARVEVSADVARHTWQHHREISGLDQRMADDLERLAEAYGSDPSLWRVSYDDVPIEKILQVEASDDSVTWAVVGVVRQAEFLIDPAFLKRVNAALDTTNRMRCLPFKRPIPQTKARPNEELWKVWAPHTLFACELKYQGEFGVEAQIFENGHLLVRRRFDTRALAVNWADEQRKDIRKAAGSWRLA
jgi:hypothetical protein